MYHTIESNYLEEVKDNIQHKSDSDEYEEEYLFELEDEAELDFN